MSWQQREFRFDGPDPEMDAAPVTILPPRAAWIDSWRGSALELRRSDSGDQVLVWIDGHEVWFPKHRVVS